jgi:hypothetical protein
MTGAPRWRPVLLAACCLGLAGCGGDAAPAQPPAAQDGTALLRADPWIATLLQPCEQDGYFELRNADPAEWLLRKLETGRDMPQKRALEEFGALGAEALPVLRRRLLEQLDDPSQAGAIQNTLGAIGQIEGRAATQSLLEGLGHPQPPVRLTTLRILGHRPLEPEDFDLLMPLVHFTQGAEAPLAARLLHAADPARAELRVLDWLEQGLFLEFEEVLLEELAGTRLPATLERARELLPALPPRSRLWLTAVLAAGGDGAARDELRTALVDPRLEIRSSALRAALATQAYGELAAVVAMEPDPALRLQAIGGLGGALAVDAAESGDGERDRARAALRAALEDPEPAVAAEARAQLFLHGEPEATERLLMLLDGTLEQMSAALPLVQQRMAVDPSLAARVERQLRARIDSESHLPVDLRKAAYQALGLVPSVAAARTLIETGREWSDRGERLRGEDAHRWFAVHASNTGPDGRAWIAEQLAEETHPQRRLDLAWAVGSQRDDLARRTLFELVEREDLDPLERLHAASLLANVGPALEVAPRLARVALTLDGEARTAMQCLLHLWY